MISLLLAAAIAVFPADVSPPASGPALEPVPYQRVSIGGSFWAPRLKVFRRATLEANRHQCDITGRLANFDRAAKKLGGDANPGAFEGLLFNDSDVYKVLEGWSYAVACEPDAAERARLDAELDAVIARIAAAQHPDGYIDTYYTLKAGVDQRLTREQWDHETYCMGHLIEAGVAHAQATGKSSLLTVAVRAADFLDGVYTRQGFAVPSGHQEIELALVKLSAQTGEKRYAELAWRMVELRGRPHTALDGKQTPAWGDYAQDHKPAAEQLEAAGHAVRAGYLYCAMADLSRLGYADYRPALDSLWRDVTERRIFVTGGIGPSAHNEGFTVPYDIPTRSAYQETCASIALCLWAHRMFLLEGDGRYMEQFERTLYNAVLAGVSEDGKRFFYVNPLESLGREGRRDWFACACCPPNVLRFFGQLGGYAYAVKGDTVYVNLFIESKAAVTVAGAPVVIEQVTGYPFDGAVKLSVRNSADRPVSIAVRDNRGMGGTDGEAASSGYRRIVVPAGQDVVTEWRIPMDVRRVYADPRVRAASGRVAFVRGPLVFAAEGKDNAGSVAGLLAPVGSAVAETIGADGAPVITVDGLRAGGEQDAQSDPGGGLYRAGRELKPEKVVLRPYFGWCNRGPTSMAVWLPESASALGPAPLSGVKASASFVGNGDGPVAALDRVLPESSSDQGVPRMTFWPHKGKEGSHEWLAYRFDAPKKISSVGVYWFDDTGQGECRAPASCVLERREGDGWKEVAEVGVAKDKLNRVQFQPITTSELRLRIVPAPGFSAGVLEWEVTDGDRGR